MKDKPDAARRRFHIHETSRLHALEGLPLATFWQRVLGFLIDLFLALLLWIPLEYCWRRFLLHETNITLRWDFHEVGNIVTMVSLLGHLQLLRQRPDSREVVGADEGSVADQRSPREVAVGRTGTRIWCGGAGGWLRVRPLLLGS